MFDRLKQTLFIALAATVAAGCSGTQQADEGGMLPGAEGGLVVVDNTETGAGSPITVYLVPETGTREQLGSVDPDSQQQFAVQPETGFRYHLVADLGTEEIASPEFTFSENMMVEWDIATNQVNTPPGE